MGEGVRIRCKHCGELFNEHGEVGKIKAHAAMMARSWGFFAPKKVFHLVQLKEAA